METLRQLLDHVKGRRETTKPHEERDCNAEFDYLALGEVLLEASIGIVINGIVICGEGIGVI